MLVSGAGLGINTPVEFLTRALNERIIASQKLRAGNTGTTFREHQEATYGTRIGGILCEEGQEQNPNRILLFPFNPEEITDAKGINVVDHPHNGFNFNDHVWANGGPRTISFKLHFEATAAVNTPSFGRNPTYGDDQIDTLNVYFPRGTLDYCELLQSFMVPSQLDPDAPRFTNGGPIPSPKFKNIPVVVFAYGNYYLRGYVTSAPIVHTLVDRELIPRRSTAEVTFTVFEQTILSFKNIIGNPVPEPDYLGDPGATPPIA